MAKLPRLKENAYTKKERKRVLLAKERGEPIVAKKGSVAARLAKHYKVERKKPTRNLAPKRKKHRDEVVGKYVKTYYVNQKNPEASIRAVKKQVLSRVEKLKKGKHVRIRFDFLVYYEPDRNIESPGYGRFQAFKDAKFSRGPLDRSGGTTHLFDTDDVDIYFDDTNDRNFGPHVPDVLRKVIADGYKIQKFVWSWEDQ